MYDNNPFREVKKIMQESDFMKKLQFVMDPVHAQYGDPGAQNRESMRAALLKKKKDHMEMVRKGELTQAEFDRLEKQGEFDIKEENDYQRLAQMDPREPFGSEEDYEAKQDYYSQRDRGHSAREHVRRFISKNPGPIGHRVMKDLRNAEVKQHDENTSVVRAGDQTFTVDHKSGEVKVVS